MGGWHVDVTLLTQFYRYSDGTEKVCRRPEFDIKGEQVQLVERNGERFQLG